MTGAHRTTGHCPLSPCPRLLFSFSPPPQLVSSSFSSLSLSRRSTVGGGEGFRTHAPLSQDFFSSSNFSLSIFAPRESGTGINFLTMFWAWRESRVSPLKFLTVAFLSRRGRLSNPCRSMHDWSIEIDQDEQTWKYRFLCARFLIVLILKSWTIFYD